MMKDKGADIYHIQGNSESVIIVEVNTLPKITMDDDKFDVTEMANSIRKAWEAEDGESVKNLIGTIWESQQEP